MADDPYAKWRTKAAQPPPPYPRCGFQRKVRGGTSTCTLFKGHIPPEHNEGTFVLDGDPATYPGFLPQKKPLTPRGELPAHEPKKK